MAERVFLQSQHFSVSNGDRILIYLVAVAILLFFFVLLPDWNVDFIWYLSCNALEMKILFYTLSVWLEIINFRLELKLKYFHIIWAHRKLSQTHRVSLLPFEGISIFPGISWLMSFTARIHALIRKSEMVLFLKPHFVLDFTNANTVFLTTIFWFIFPQTFPAWMLLYPT